MWTEQTTNPNEIKGDTIEWPQPNPQKKRINIDKKATDRTH